jgi:iron complex transport system substrate-binding protein
LILFFGILGCQQKNQNQPSKKINWISADYAKLFKIGIIESDTLLKIFFVNGKEIATYHLGNNPNSFPDAIHINHKNKLAVSSSIFARFLTELDLGNSIVAIDNLNFLHSSIKSQLQNPIEIQPSGELQLETLINCKPDVFFVYTLNAEGIPAFTRLQKKNIPVIYIQNHQENHPLARAEWIKVFGLITDRLERANKIFKQVDSTYSSLLAKQNTQKSRTMINAPYSGNWMVPNRNNYFSKLMVDANLQCSWQEDKIKQEQLSYTISLESAMNYLLLSDIWINVGSYENIESLIKSESRIQRILQANTDLKIFQNNKQQELSGANSYWDLGSTHPEILLKDLININLGKTDSLHFYIQIR